MSQKFSIKDLDCLQEEYELSKENAYKFNPMFDEEKKLVHDNIMRSEEVRKKISDTMKNKINKGEFFTEEHRKNLKKALKDSIYIYNDERITRIKKKNLQKNLDSGWKIYEKRSYAQLCNKEMMTVKTNNFKMFATRCSKCYCITDKGERFDFKSIRDATVWWFENYHPFGEHYSECTLQRKIKVSAKGDDITYKAYSNWAHTQKKGCLIKITNVKWFIE